MASAPKRRRSAAVGNAESPKQNSPRQGKSASGALGQPPTTLPGPEGAAFVRLLAGRAWTRPVKGKPIEPELEQGERSGRAADVGLKRRRKPEPDKLEIEARVETALTVGGTAERLRMGTRGHLNPLLYRRRKATQKQP